MAERKKIFIVHHESDRNEKELVYSHLAPYEKIGLLKFWCTSNILPGQNVSEEIDKALKDVKVAIPLISIDFLNKKLDSQEMEIVFANHRKNGLKLFPILIRPCIWETVNWLKDIKMIPKDNKALSLYPPNLTEEVLANFSREIKGSLEAV